MFSICSSLNVICFKTTAPVNFREGVVPVFCFVFINYNYTLFVSFFKRFTITSQPESLLYMYM